MVKIKGGNWTVFRFGLVSIAYTSVWLAVSSDLKYLKEIYGPRILLLLNLAYYAPGIPLLIASSFLDQHLERHYGVARTIFYRLLVGLLGYGFLAAIFPFLPSTITCLLTTVMALGAFSGIAFSASYQLVSRFANKNVIALGLGCSISGPLVLALQLLYGSHRVFLYESIAVMIGAGLWATVSLLFRHWEAIEDSTREVVADGEQPLLSAHTQQDGSGGVGGDSIETNVELGGVSPKAAALSSRYGPHQGLLKHPSLPPLLAYDALEPYATFLDTEEEWPAYIGWTLFDGSGRGGSEFARRHSDPETWTASSQQTIGNAVVDGGGDGGVNGGGLSTGIASTVGGGAGTHINNINSIERPDDDERINEAISPVLTTMKCIWPALVSVGIQAGISLTLFPFFTYLPSSGLLGDGLARFLFFFRIFTDIIGRWLPRLKLCSPATIWPVFSVALLKLAAEPLFFLYLKSPEVYHSDVLAVGYVGVMWMLSGYINTAANMHAPLLVSPSLKSTAAGLMAIVYQLGHFVGLAIAVVLVRLMYGDV